MLMFLGAGGNQTMCEGLTHISHESKYESVRVAGYSVKTLGVGRELKKDLSVSIP